ncbi:MAG: MoxR family ATPase [Arcanobacterium sp.]|nr:MoxR family ATPase [Arcanobacterium sp.]MDY5589306.1 MoxR family ATPase [Arcanobacterium sp.]
MRTEISKAVVGQDQAVSAVLIGLLTNGHILLEGVPGTAKTLLVRSLAAALSTDFKRVQFTPDLMPGDLTGSLIYSSSTGEFTFRPGPVFTNILLADEINRTPPKTQAALLEAMAEHQVSVDGQAKELPDPFLVVATQNPIEYEGTYSLPEAQLDRFLMKVTVPLPEPAVEFEMLKRHAGSFDPNDLRTAGIRPVASATTALAAREQVKEITVHESILAYIVELVQATRVNPAVRVAVSPRGTTALLSVCRAWAWLNGRTFVTPDDVKAFALPALGHRMQLQPEAQLDGLTTEQVLTTILSSVPAPR